MEISLFAKAEVTQVFLTHCSTYNFLHVEHPIQGNILCSGTEASDSLEREEITLIICPSSPPQTLSVQDCSFYTLDVIFVPASA